MARWYCLNSGQHLKAVNHFPGIGGVPVPRQTGENSQKIRNLQKWISIAGNFFSLLLFFSKGTLLLQLFGRKFKPVWFIKANEFHDTSVRLTRWRNTKL